MDGSSFSDYASKFSLLIELHCAFLMFFKMVPFCILWLYSDHWLGRNRQSLFRARFTSFHTHASLLTFFVCLSLISFLLFPCASVWDNSLAWVLHFLYIAILNGTCFFHFLVQEKLNLPSGHYYRHWSCSGRLNRLIIKFIAFNCKLLRLAITYMYCVGLMALWRFFEKITFALAIFFIF